MKFLRVILIVTFIFLFVPASFGQSERTYDHNSAVDVFKTWKVKQSKGSVVSDRVFYKGIGVLVTRIDDSTITIEVAVKASVNADTPRRIKIMVQPLGMPPNGEDGAALEAVGIPATIAAPHVTRGAQDKSDIVFSPRLRMSVPENAIAIDVEVAEFFDKEHSVASLRLLIKARSNTGMIETFSGSKSSFEKQR